MIRVTWNLSRNRVPRNSLESVASSNLGHLRADLFWELVVQLRAVELVEICWPTHDTLGK